MVVNAGWRPGRHNDACGVPDECDACCELFADNFETGNLPATLDTVQGTWSVSCLSTCVLNGSGAHAIIKTVATRTGAAGVKANYHSGEARLIIHYDGPGDYVCAEIDDATPGGAVRIITRSSGSDTTRETKTPVSGISQEWFFCSNDTCYALVSADGNHAISWNHGTSLPATAQPAAFAVTPGGTSASFDAAGFYEPGGKEDLCPTCNCACDGCTTNAMSAPATVTVDTTGTLDVTGCFGRCVSGSTDGVYGLSKVSDCKYEYSVSRVDWKVYKIVLDIGQSPPKLEIFHRADCFGVGQTDQLAVGFAGGDIADCSEGNISESITVSGGCISGAVSVTG